MSAGELAVIEYLGQEDCFTPACGYNRETNQMGKADVVQVGRVRLQICQRCGGHKPTRYSDSEGYGHGV